MNLKLYIEDLLYRYECVIVPEFGAFLTHYKSAQIHQSTHAFYPPNKEVSFNSQLTNNDGLLASYISSVTENPYEKVLKDIKNAVAAWNQTLDEGKKIAIDNIGVLRKSENGNIQFQPSYRVNYLMDSFGLASFVSSAVEREVPEVEAILSKKIEEVQPTAVLEENLKVSSKEIEKASEEKKVVEKKSTDPPTVIAIKPMPSVSKRVYLKYAAVAFLAVSLGLTSYVSYNQFQDNAVLAQEEATVEINQKIQEATFTIPTELPSANVAVKKVTDYTIHKNNATADADSARKYQIIAGAFREEANANKKVVLLRKKSYKAVKLGKNRYGLYQVAYGTFDNRNAALHFLAKVRNQEDPDAWLYISR